MRIIIILFCFISSIVFSQDVSTKIEDINGDNFKDTIRIFYEGGSGFGGKFCTLINGKTNEIHKMDNWGCYCQIKNIILIPPALRKEENKAFLDAVKEEILPERSDGPDPSLKWIIEGTISKYKLSDDKYFNFIIHTSPQWLEGSIKFPKTYYIDLKGDALHKLYVEYSETPDSYDQKENEGWLIYYGHNHFRNPNGDSITLVDSSGNYLAYRTSHGVIIKKGNKYAWIFVTDNDLTGAPQKLRWESVKTVKIIDDYVIVQQNLPIAMITNIFVIDIERGICGQLKTASYGSEPFIVHDNKLFVISDGKKELFLLEEIFKELMTQHKAKPNKN